MDTKLILDFMKKLAVNNNTGWMAVNKKEYEKVKYEFSNLIQILIERLSLTDKSLIGLTSKECIFKLNRDTRFSLDKRPYKEHMSAYIVNGGKKNFRAGYYFQIQPDGQSLVAGGVHIPPSDALLLIRKEISNYGDELSKVLADSQFKLVFPELVGEKLKKVPKGFSPDDKYVEYLKLKSFDVISFYEDKQVLDSQNLIDDVIEKFILMRPLNNFFNNSLVDYTFVPRR